MTAPVRLIAGDDRQFTAGPSTDLENFNYMYIPSLGDSPPGLWQPPHDTVKLLDRDPERLDQLATSACTRFSVGNASKAWGKQPTYEQCIKGYRRAQQIDEWPGEEPRYYGTSINAALKAAREEGLVTGWRWISQVDHIVAAILFGHAVLFPAVWTEGMAYPNKASLMSAHGAEIGGHATCLNGWIGPWGLIQVENSWGARWGNDGLAYMPWEAFKRKWAEWPEAAIPFFS